MTPIPPGAILSFLQAGYPADLCCGSPCIPSMAYIAATVMAHDRARQIPSFFHSSRNCVTFSSPDKSDLRVKRTGTETATSIVFSKKFTPAIAADRDEVRKLLGLNPETDEFNVVYGSVAANDKEIALLTRSVLEILTDLSSYTDVPAANVEQKRTFPSPAPEIVNGAPVPALIRILSSPQKPDDAFVAVPYGQNWYWIDDKDFASKRLFSFIMFLFTLTEPGDKQGAPVITIPAG